MTPARRERLAEQAFDSAWNVFAGGLLLLAIRAIDRWKPAADAVRFDHALEWVAESIVLLVVCALIRKAVRR